MDVVTAARTESDRYAELARTTGIIGITFMVLLFGPIIALASADEPPLEATAAEAVKYFGNLEATWAQRPPCTGGPPLRSPIMRMRSATSVSRMYGSSWPTTTQRMPGQLQEPTRDLPGREAWPKARP
jgi:hypothetical protein